MKQRGRKLPHPYAPIHFSLPNYFAFYTKRLLTTWIRRRSLSQIRNSCYFFQGLRSGIRWIYYFRPPQAPIFPYRKRKLLIRGAAMDKINSRSKVEQTLDKAISGLQLTFRRRQIEISHCVQKACSQKFLYSSLPSTIIWVSFRKVLSVVHDLLIFPAISQGINVASEEAVRSDGIRD